MKFYASFQISSNQLIISASTFVLLAFIYSRLEKTSLYNNKYSYIKIQFSQHTLFPYKNSPADFCDFRISTGELK
jgi:hypothetical protein